MPGRDIRPGADGRGQARAQDADRHVATRLRERRRALGLSQRQLAERVGTIHQQIYRYEKGTGLISVERLLAFARALGVEPDYFFEGLGTGEPARPTAEQRRLLELAEGFVALPRWQQEALLKLVRTLAGADADPEREEARDDGPA
jgi:transcriptional regulator with XRE-family HTH domain